MNDIKQLRNMLKTLWKMEDLIYGMIVVAEQKERFEKSPEKFIKELKTIQTFEPNDLINELFKPFKKDKLLKNTDETEE